MTFVSTGGCSFVAVWPCGSPYKGSKRKPKTATRAALVEVRPRAPPVLRSDGSATPVFAWDRAEDLQAEARAMARAANATVYSPENLAGKYSSRPIQVQFLIYLFFYYGPVMVPEFHSRWMGIGNLDRLGQLRYWGNVVPF